MTAPRLPALTDEATIAAFVRRFYELADAHPRLGPLFARHIVDGPAHQRIVCDFWSKVLLGTDRYAGHPYPVHQSLGIEREHFDDWLGALKAAAEAVLPPDAAALALGTAEHMTRSFRAGLFPFDRT